MQERSFVNGRSVRLRICIDRPAEGIRSGSGIYRPITSDHQKSSGLLVRPVVGGSAALDCGAVIPVI